MNAEELHDMLPQLAWRLDPGAMPGVLQAGMVTCLPFDTKTFSVGIDPGKRWGLGIVWGGVLFMGYGAFAKDLKLYEVGVEAYRLAISERFRMRPWGHLLHAEHFVIEGPAYGAPYGQPGLMAVRMGFALAPLHYDGAPGLLVPPASVRARVTGHGRVELLDVLKEHLPLKGPKTAWKKWEEAADALACALYPIMESTDWAPPPVTIKPKEKN